METAFPLPGGKSVLDYIQTQGINPAEQKNTMIAQTETNNLTIRKGENYHDLKYHIPQETRQEGSDIPVHGQEKACSFYNSVKDNPKVIDTTFVCVPECEEERYGDDMIEPNCVQTDHINRKL